MRVTSFEYKDTAEGALLWVTRHPNWFEKHVLRRSSTLTYYLRGDGHIDDDPQWSNWYTEKSITSQRAQRLLEDMYQSAWLDEQVLRIKEGARKLAVYRARWEPAIAAYADILRANLKQFQHRKIEPRTLADIADVIICTLTRMRDAEGLPDPLPGFDVETRPGGYVYINWRD